MDTTALEGVTFLFCSFSFEIFFVFSITFGIMDSMEIAILGTNWFVDLFGTKEKRKFFSFEISTYAPRRELYER